MRPLNTYSLIQRRRNRANRLRTTTQQRIGRAGFGLGALLAVLLAAASLLAGLAYVNLTSSLPSLDALPALLDPTSGPLLQPTRFYDRSGEQVIRVLAEPGVERRYLTLDPNQPNRLSPDLARLVVGALDPDWERHTGTRLEVLLQDEPATLAERLVSDLLLDQEAPGLRRNLRMRLLSAQVTARFGRQQVLEWFLNEAYYGHLAYGAEAAAQTYLGKSATDLNLGEAALLASLLETPALNPMDAPEAARQRQAEFLNELLEHGVISSDERKAALDAPLAFRAAPETENTIPQAFTNLAVTQLSAQISLNRLERGGLDVITTLDPALQAELLCATRVQAARMQGLPDPEDTAACEAARLLPTLPQTGQPASPQLQASAAVLDPKTGQVLALVGETGPGGETGSLLAHAPGTTLTPWIYLAGFARGMGPASLVWDAPLQLSSSDSLVQMEQPNPSAPGPEAYHGPVRLRVALSNDYWVPAETLQRQMGAESIWRSAVPFGLTTGLNALTSSTDRAGFPFEGGQAGLLEIAQAYGVFAAEGVLNGQPLQPSSQELHPAAVLEVRDSREKVLLDWRQPKVQSVLSAPLTYLMNSVLTDESARWPSLGHPNPLEIGRPAGAKIGSTTDGFDTWAVGYTPQRVTVVWVGVPGAGEAAPVDRRGAAGLWHALMQYATRDLPPETWKLPAGVVQAEVCDPSGLLPTPYCPMVVNEVFLSSSVPFQEDNLYRAYLINRETGRLATVFTPPELIDERVYLVVPPEAQAWADQTGLPVPPSGYDAIQAPEMDPNVRILTPDMFAMVKGSVQIRGTAAGEGFSYYRVQVGQGLNPRQWFQVGTDQNQPVEDGLLAAWDTKGLSGLYAIRLMIVRTDQRVDTATVQVTVDNTAPTVAVTYPDPGARFWLSERKQVTFQVSVQDEIGLERVEWYVDGKQVSTQVQAPFSFPWKLSGEGRHTVQARAYDRAGNLASSEEIDFIVYP